MSLNFSINSKKRGPGFP